MNRRSLFIGTLLLFGLFCAGLSFYFSANRDLAETVVGSDAKAPPIIRSLRPNYPYSVIAGGAYSKDELVSAAYNDPLVRVHYANFDIANARTVVTTRDQKQYVSYRLKGHIYWTKNRITIPRGETLLTDGRSFARTRCGNRLASSRPGNVSPAEPAIAELTLPPFDVQQLPNLELAASKPFENLEYLTLMNNEPRLAPIPPSPTELTVTSDYFGGETQESTPLNLTSYPALVPGSVPFPLLIARAIPPAGPAPIPEPSLTWPLWLFGFALILFARTRFKHRTA